MTLPEKLRDIIRNEPNRPSKSWNAQKALDFCRNMAADLRDDIRSLEEIDDERAQRLIRRIREELYGLSELEAELIRKRAELRVPIS